MTTRFLSEPYTSIKMNIEKNSTKRQASIVTKVEKRKEVSLKSINEVEELGEGYKTYGS